MSNIKNLQKLCQKYTRLGTRVKPPPFASPRAYFHNFSYCACISASSSSSSSSSSVCCVCVCLRFAICRGAVCQVRVRVERGGANASPTVPLLRQRGGKPEHGHGCPPPHRRVHCLWPCRPGACGRGEGAFRRIGSGNLATSSAHAAHLLTLYFRFPRKPKHRQHRRCSRALHSRGE